MIRLPALAVALILTAGSVHAQTPDPLVSEVRAAAAALAPRVIEWRRDLHQHPELAHACGHDAHVAMLLGAAQVLAGMKDRIPGTVVFIFQPAEEDAPPGEPLGGARLMIREGALENPKVEAIFGLHVVPGRLGVSFSGQQAEFAATLFVNPPARTPAHPWLSCGRCLS